MCNRKKRRVVKTKLCRLSVGACSWFFVFSCCFSDYCKGKHLYCLVLLIRVSHFYRYKHNGENRVIICREFPMRTYNLI